MAIYGEVNQLVLSMHLMAMHVMKLGHFSNMEHCTIGLPSPTQDNCVRMDGTYPVMKNGLIWS